MCLYRSPNVCRTCSCVQRLSTSSLPSQCIISSHPQRYPFSSLTTTTSLSQSKRWCESWVYIWEPLPLFLLRAPSSWHLQRRHRSPALPRTPRRRRRRPEPAGHSPQARAPRQPSRYVRRPLSIDRLRRVVCLSVCCAVIATREKVVPAAASVAAQGRRARTRRGPGRRTPRRCGGSRRTGRPRGRADWGRR